MNIHESKILSIISLWGMLASLTAFVISCFTNVSEGFVLISISLAIMFGMLWVYFVDEVKKCKEKEQYNAEQMFRGKKEIGGKNAKSN